MSTQLTVKTLFSQDNVKKKFEEMMGKKAQGFITSVLQIVSSNKLLVDADPMSIYNSACVAATLDLPINNNLGFAYIIPFNQSYQEDGVWKKKQVAQFQIGYKGFKQLALRSGQFLTIHATDVREGEIKKHDRLTGEIEFAWIEDHDARVKKTIVGYVSYFKLLNGYSQTFYMTSKELNAHGLKYSQTFQKDKGLWKDDFSSMCLKTVTKLNLSKNAPLSIEMQKAVITDQAVINNAETEDITYVDNQEPIIDKEAERIQLLIADCLTTEDLKALQEANPEMDAELIKAQEFIIKSKSNGKPKAK